MSNSATHRRHTIPASRVEAGMILDYAGRINTTTTDDEYKHLFGA